MYPVYMTQTKTQMLEQIAGARADLAILAYNVRLAGSVTSQVSDGIHGGARRLPMTLLIELANEASGLAGNVEEALRQLNGERPV